MLEKLLYTRQQPCPKKIKDCLFQHKIEVIDIPLIQTVGLPVTYDKNQWQKIDWVFFTSVNAVKFTDLTCLPENCKIASIGDKTTQALVSQGLTVDFQPSAAYSEGMVEEWLAGHKEKEQILLLNSRLSRRVIKDKLEQEGHKVYQIPIYDTIFPKKSEELLDDILLDQQLTYLIIASPSAWHHFYQRVQLLGCSLNQLKILSIGPISTKAIQQDGFSVFYQADIYDMPHLFKGFIKEIESNGNI
ncbi:uroporphyrinogen-III synthase [Vagococcus humatus]|uniref:Uroporphyrinogen-III synthase n=1 Tax=Vagococcus humatus TaxID=1889241 RepID=A0A3R9ZY02_9ENTE|nr:uroporphyrinogen-III synthase [Vagococcus humatus]RST90305.1 hypothetical protein C7P63_04325 [Vagococcus humatus]